MYPNRPEPSSQASGAASGLAPPRTGLAPPRTGLAPPRTVLAEPRTERSAV